MNVRMSKKHDRHDVLTGENSAHMVPIKASIICAHLPIEDLSFWTPSCVCSDLRRSAHILYTIKGNLLDTKLQYCTLCYFIAFQFHFFSPPHTPKNMCKHKDATTAMNTNSRGCININEPLLYKNVSGLRLYIASQGARFVIFIFQNHK